MQDENEIIINAKYTEITETVKAILATVIIWVFSLKKCVQ